MTITSSLFEAFLKWPMKCWLRAAKEEPPSGNVYAEWVYAQDEAYRIAETNRLAANLPHPDYAVSPLGDSVKSAKWHFASKGVVRATATPCGGPSKEVPRCLPASSEMDSTSEPAWRPEVGFARKNLEQRGVLKPTERSGRGVRALKERDLRPTQ